MPLTINTLRILNEYITGVMGRADHHGPNVNEIALAIAGAVIWKSTDDVEVRTYAGETANVLWMTVNGNRYALCYNHGNGTIELRDRTIQGNVLASFDNATPIADIKTVFNRL
jgi:hypothetical protein